MGDAEYTPQDPGAYAGRPALLTPPWRRSPFVVDAPGVFVGGDGGEGEPRLVHWESIREVVLYETTVGTPNGIVTVDAVGLRLRSRPDVIAVQRVLTSWRLDRAALEAAVARFAPGVAVVDGPSQNPRSRDRIRSELERAPRDDPDGDVAPRPVAPEPGAPPQAGRLPARATARLPARATPATARRRRRVPVYGSPDAGPGPAAYVVRADSATAGRHVLFAAVGIGVAVYGTATGLGPIALVFLIFCAPLAMHIRAARRGVVYFAVDTAGVYLGEAVADHGPVEVRAPWESIAVVTVFEVEDSVTRHGRRRGAWHQAVGVTLRGDTPDGPRDVTHYQVFQGYGLDRARLEAAVARFGGGTPVVDGPALGNASLGDIVGALADFFRDSGR
jgi:hypothetical protein